MNINLNAINHQSISQKGYEIMDKILDYKSSNFSSGVTVELCGNYNVKGIFAHVKSEVEVKYAQNSVTDTLTSIGNFKPDENGELKINLQQPINASHIYFYANTEISNITVIEFDGVNLLNLYPKCYDIPLKENYYLNTVTVHTQSEGFSNYSLYTSLNGRDFELVAVKSNDKPCRQEGDLYSLNGKEARIIRVYYEYNSASPESGFEGIDFSGEPSGTPIIKRPEINICDFKDSEYNIPVTDKDAVDEVFGIVERRLGKEYKFWFEFVIGEKKKYDYFSIAYENGKIKIIGNTGVSVAAGLNHYLKYYCKVNISQVGDQVKMPAEIVIPKEPVYRETKARVRYAYNFCTYSYSYAFWGEKEWRNELDWLALNGVNTVLDIIGQEEVWRRFLSKLGYKLDEIKAFIPGPAYCAWFNMANMFGFGGPFHDSWFEERTQLARRNHLIMKKLGMQPVLQGYSGMVPIDIKKYDPEAEIISQGTWGGMQRPAMLKTDTETFSRYSQIFYTVQKEVFGDAIYFATDPFHEGGVTGGMSPRTISKIVLSQMLKANPEAVWVIQSWQSNPSSELLAGLSDVNDGRKHALILDLYAEKTPNYCDGKPGNSRHGYSAEFDGTPWVYCMLNNFGGRLGLHGHLDNIVSGIPKVLNECEYLSGIGITCEASENNPVLYDFLFESVWQENAEYSCEQIDIKRWIREYTRRRYGGESNAVNEAWDIMLNTVYKAECNMIGQGAPESIVNARPKLGLNSASFWGNSLIGYSKAMLEKAEKLLLEDYNKFSDSNGYKYDLISLRQQVLSNKALDFYNDICNAYNRKNLNEFNRCSEEFLNLADQMNNMTDESEYYRLSRYLNLVNAITENKDDFTKRIYKINAKALITTFFASDIVCERIHDYSNRQWAGLISDFYKKRWEIFFGKCKKEIADSTAKEINWFEWEWNWVRK